MKANTMKRESFTLIELLIVVAIIGILAAIAVPNFLNAQTRAKLARVQSDLRAAEMGLEAYHIDHNAYPYPATTPPNRLINVWELTTPVSYLPSLNSMDDPFKPRKFFTPELGNADTISYLYHNFRGYWGRNFEGLPSGTCLKSDGPGHQPGPGRLTGSHYLFYVHPPLNPPKYGGIGKSGRCSRGWSFQQIPEVQAECLRSQPP